MSETVDGINDLPAPESNTLLLGTVRSWYYLRSLSDPTALIDGQRGTVYRRHDGAPWAEPAYWVRRERNDSLTRQPTTAYADHKQYGTDEMADAA